MAEEERKGSRLGRALSVVFSFRGSRQGGNGRASTSIVPARDAAAVDDVSSEAVPSDEEEIKLFNQALAESGLGILAKVDAAGRIVQANEDTEQATGKNGRNLKGTDLFSWFNDPKRVRQLLEQAVETGATVRSDNLDIRHRDGFETPVSTTIMIQQDSDDRVLGGILLCRA